VTLQPCIVHRHGLAARLHEDLSMLRMLVLTMVLLTACATDSNEPSSDDLAELDGWAAAADGKSDLPSTWTELVAWLRDFYTNTMSAVWNRQEHPTTADAAIARVRGMVTNPTTRLYSARVQRLRVDLVDHSEVDVQIAPNKVLRLVGDPKGAGAFVDRAMFEQSIGAPLCLTWSELETAIRASYASGAYGVDYVCHTITERVLRALGAGSASYAAQIRTYAAARWTWGPIVPSFHSQDPADWSVSRACR
jgi:hypothetical protein